jgi:hypothetical protein
MKTLVKDDKPISIGQLFIVPPIVSTRPTNGIAGCCEGRHDSIGYKLPIALECKSVSDTHINSKGYGSWIKDACYIEVG